MRAKANLDLVRRLLTSEAAEAQDQEAMIRAAERVSDKLCVRLSKTIGPEGFRTLLARALALTTAQFPALNAVRVGGDGSLVGMSQALDPNPQEPQNADTQQAVAEGAVALVAQLLGLLVTFIGKDITQRILSAVWPELTFDDADDWKDERP